MSNIYEEVFGVQLTNDEIIANIAFKIMGKKANEKIILVEGYNDVQIYNLLSKRIDDFNPFFVDCEGKKSVLSYLQYDKNQYAILDRDFDNNSKMNKLYFTKYANIEADLLNSKDIEEFIKNSDDEIKKYAVFFNLIESIEEKIYKNGIYRKCKINNKFNLDWLEYSEKELFQEKIYEKNKSKNTKIYIGDGIHCSKTIIKIMAKIKNKSREEIIKELLSSSNDESPIMMNIKKIHNSIQS